MKSALSSLLGFSTIYYFFAQLNSSEFIVLADKYGVPTAFVLLLTVLVLWFQNKSDKDRRDGLQKLIDSSVRQELWLKSILAAREQQNICRYYESKTESKNNE